MTKEMREFLTAWLDWATSGDVKGHKYGCIFRPYTGLCAAADYWTVDDGPAHYELISELGDMLEADGLATDYPFDTPRSYDDAAGAGTQHLNPARLEWVRSKLECSDG